jgi:hypothetical protein
MVEAETAVEQLLGERQLRATRPAEEWCAALRAQARSDLTALETLLAAESKDGERPWATVAMLFQMVFEKIAKAMLARTNNDAFKATLGSHAVVARFLQVVCNQGKYAGIASSIKRERAVLRQLERSHPALAKGQEQLEYPWEDDDGVRLPAESTLVKLLSDPRAPRAVPLVRLASELLRRFDELFC